MIQGISPFEFDRYQSVSKSKHICPNCGERKFVWVVYRGTHDPVDPDVYGKCDRIGCYSKWPGRDVKALSILMPVVELPKPIDYIPVKYLDESLSNVRYSDFWFILSEKYGELVADELCKTYNIGGGINKPSNTLVWQVDEIGRVCQVQLFKYNRNTGKRAGSSCYYGKDIMELEGVSNANLKAIINGRGILARSVKKRVYVTESVKNAITVCVFFAGSECIAINSASWVNLLLDRALFEGKEIVLVPDSKGLELWMGKARAIESFNSCTVSLFDLHLRGITREQWEADWDITDWIESA